ncbi:MULTISPECIES: GNAT family N-acetyltransferase [unclassified Alteromonas]|uniref:GNAT family N-acetyltransferase n=1 Tax=unclassified Alteromonas TaxID=2614992 RepID=UPI000509E438|nr:MULTISPECIES: GNAT family N-acetyltransferase [unclassified Alteromonas]
MSTTKLRYYQNSEQLFNDTAEFWESYSPPNIFLSKEWLTSWLDSVDTIPLCMIFYDCNYIIGIVVVGETLLRPYLPQLREWHCNQTGGINEDQVWIEYNHIYCNVSQREKCTALLIEQFIRQPLVVTLNVSMAENVEHWKSKSPPLIKWLQNGKHIGYKKTLTECSSVSDVIASLSRNSRSQMRRAFKKAKSSWGDVSVTVATQAKKLDFLNELGLLHKEKWDSSTYGSGFSNENFLSHHKKLIELAPSLTDIVKVEAGEHLLGLCYFLKCDNSIKFYCSGINENVSDKHIKPGYLIHIACMAHYGSKGFSDYDFLGGGARYKSTLSDSKYTFTDLRLWNISRVGRLLASIHSLRSKLIKHFSKPSPDSPQQ